jgi:cbb3-type cytochrome oxidase subunit 1
MSLYLYFFLLKRMGNMGVRLIKISVVYLVIGILMGMYMSIAHTYTLTPVHVHVNLLGWAAMMGAGILYHLFPEAGSSRLGVWHFGLHNIGLPIMMLALSFVVYGNDSFVLGIIVGSTLVTIAIILFMFNVFINVRKS